MARVQAARAQMAFAFETVMASRQPRNYRTVPFASTMLGSEQRLIASEPLGRARDPLAAMSWTPRTPGSG